MASLDVEFCAEREQNNALCSFTQELLALQAEAAIISSGGPPAKILKTVAGGVKYRHQVLDARFALCTDSGAYLRTNVQLLQTTADDDIHNQQNLADLLPEVRQAGRRGLLGALGKQLTEQKDKCEPTYGQAKGLVEWLLSIEEVSTFCEVQMGHAVDLDTPANLRDTAVCLGMMFGQPLQHLEAQVKKATDSAKTVYDNQKRLAYAASLMQGAHDSYPPRRIGAMLPQMSTGDYPYTLGPTTYQEPGLGGMPLPQLSPQRKAELRETLRGILGGEVLPGRQDGEVVSRLREVLDIPFNTTISNLAQEAEKVWKESMLDHTNDSKIEEYLESHLIGKNITEIIDAKNVFISVYNQARASRVEPPSPSPPSPSAPPTAGDSAGQGEGEAPEATEAREILDGFNLVYGTRQLFEQLSETEQLEKVREYIGPQSSLDAADVRSELMKLLQSPPPEDTSEGSPGSGANGGADGGADGGATKAARTLGPYGLGLLGTALYDMLLQKSERYAEFLQMLDNIKEATKTVIRVVDGQGTPAMVNQALEVVSRLAGEIPDVSIARQLVTLAVNRARALAEAALALANTKQLVEIADYAEADALVVRMQELAVAPLELPEADELSKGLCDSIKDTEDVLLDAKNVAQELVNLARSPSGSKSKSRFCTKAGAFDASALIVEKAFQQMSNSVTNGVSATWKTMTKDAWYQNLWRPTASTKAAASIKAALVDNPEFPFARMMDTPQSHTVAYCMARGLCAEPAPHQEPNETFKYNRPTEKWPGAQDLQQLSTQKTKKFAISASAPPTIVNDHVSWGKKQEEYVEKQRVCKWAPVTMDGGEAEYTNQEGLAAEVSEAVLVESLVAYYKRRAEHENEQGNLPMRSFFLACAAVAKLRQMRALKEIDGRRSDQNSDPICPAYKDGKALFETRPVAVVDCESYGVLYPCDAGLGRKQPGPAAGVGSGVGGGGGVAGLSLPASDQPSNQAMDVGVDADPTVRRSSQLAASATATQQLRLMLETNETPCQLYVAPPPEGADEPEQPPTNRGQPDGGVFPDQDTDAIRNALFSVETICNTMERLQRELDYIQNREKEDQDTESSAQDFARYQRDALWSDAKRETAISGDRLWAFVRQLSGTIGESVDVACQIDDSQVAQQQKDTARRLTEASNIAAREHMNLVRTVMGSILQEGGLAMGISSTGPSDVGQFKIVSSAIRKQASELARGEGGGGFFGRAVDLQKLLSEGAGEVTIQQLFTEINKVGMELQKAALSSTSFNSPYETNSGIQLMSAPRNSLVLRYKPEALAAIRQAYTMLQTELRYQNTNSRPVSAWELMEGIDDELSGAFATLCAHLLANTRMFSTSIAPYVGVQQAAFNVHQVKMSLHRMVNAVARYANRYKAPDLEGVKRLQKQLEDPPNNALVTQVTHEDVTMALQGARLAYFAQAA